MPPNRNKIEEEIDSLISPELWEEMPASVTSTMVPRSGTSPVIMLFALVGALALGALAGGMVMYYNKDQLFTFLQKQGLVAQAPLPQPSGDFYPEGSSTPPENTAGYVAPAAPASLPPSEPIVIAKATWWGQPRTLGNLKVFNDVDATNPTTYYDLGSYGEGGMNQIIYALVPEQGPGGPSPALLVKDKVTGIYYLLTKYFNTSGYLTASIDEEPSINKAVKADNATTFAEMEAPAEIVFKGVTLVGTETRGLVPDIGSAGDLLGSSDHGAVYATRFPEEGTGYHLETLDLLLPDGETVMYSMKLPFISDDSVPAITWNDKTMNKDAYRIDGSTGCGSAYGWTILDEPVNINQLAQVGKTSDGGAVYAFKDLNNKTFNQFYKAGAGGGIWDEKAGKMGDPMTKAAFQKVHGVVVYKDALGRFVVMANQVYGTQAECGKPVIYLYPEKETSLTVKVGARIDQSEPVYGADGWSVVAQPSGDLNVQGKHYDSLYWEGFGQQYPEISGKGFVVKHAELENTLRTQLTALGLNAKESADFMAYWLPKMPATPYTRLTWLGTSDMNRLAPLTLSTQPDTMIRIFLDFAGLDAPEKIEPQHLSAPTRKGFTLVEWGGLLKR